MSKRKYIDLFCGAGGLSLGLSKAGFNLLYANDIDLNSINTFKHNLSLMHPKFSKKNIIHGDITKLYKELGTKRIYRKKIGLKTVTTNKEIKLYDIDNILTTKEVKTIKNVNNLDILCGGPPCQGFSMIGRAKRGTIEQRAIGFINDTRNYLFKYFLKFADKYKPKIILIENVKGLDSASNYRDLILKSISNCGNNYISDSCVLQAHQFGIPQNRERLFFIGIRKDISKKYNITPGKIFRDIMQRGKQIKTILLKDAIYDLPQIKNNPKPNNYTTNSEISFSDKNSFGMNISDISYNELIESSNTYIQHINKIRGKIILPNNLYNHKSRYHNKRDKYIYMNLQEGKYLNHPDNFLALNGDKINFSGVDYVRTKNKNGNKISTGFSDKYFKLNSSSISKTIIAHLETDGNSYVHPPIKTNKSKLDYARSITPREAARIQSFPDWYFFTGSLRNQFRQIGNAVPPLLSYEIGKIIKKYLKKVK